MLMHGIGQKINMWKSYQMGAYNVQNDERISNLAAELKSDDIWPPFLAKKWSKISIFENIPIFDIFLPKWYGTTIWDAVGMVQVMIYFFLILMCVFIFILRQSTKKTKIFYYMAVFTQWVNCSRDLLSDMLLVCFMSCFYPYWKHKGDKNGPTISVPIDPAPGWIGTARKK